MALDMNIGDILEEDNNYKEGSNEYQRIMELATETSEEIAAALIQEVVKKTDDGSKENALTLSTAILACAKAMVNLASYAYDTEEEFKEDIIKSRKAIVDTVIPALLDPQPCGECEECKNGSPMSCVNPDLNTEMLQTRVVPILANALVEYDTWNKVMYLYTEGRELLNTENPTEVEASKDTEVVASKNVEKEV
jgi:hypothetical protein